MLRIVAHRWRVTVPLILATLGVAIALHGSTESVFEARGSVVVTAPQVNPGGAPSDIADPAVIARAIRASDEAAALTSGDPPVEFTFDSSVGGLLQLVVSGDSQPSVERAAEALTNLTVEIAQAAQVDAGIAEDERVRVLLLSDYLTTTQGGDGQTTYTVNADVLFEDPAAGGDNPYSASPATARLLEVATQSDAGKQQVAERTGGSIEYSVKQNQSDLAPILEASALAPTREQALDGFWEVVEVVGGQLDGLQERAGVFPSQRLTVEVLAAPQSVRDVGPPISRAVAVAFALGLLLSLAGAIVAENLAERRSGRYRIGSEEGFWYVVGARPTSSAPHLEEGDEGSRNAPSQVGPRAP